MDANKQVFNYVESLTMDLFSVFERMKSIPGMYDKTIQREAEACKSIPLQIQSGIIKIAVVGAIKSGKSTFINSWLGADILKRGAGVVTSIVTRIRKGDFYNAVVFLKSWDEINFEIEQALLFFPNLENMAVLNNIAFDPSGKWFDLRRKNDRKLLNAVKRQLCHSNSVTETGLRQEAVTINQVLDGFEIIKTKIQPECAKLVFSGDNFDGYKKFTGNDSLAFFVKDVCLNIVNSDIDSCIEIADCQGSDSTNPSHMIQIQDYLVASSMIIYLVSSRTGIREADIRFLNIIQKMGLIDRVIFIINLDFDGHSSLNDFIYVENTIKQEISYIKQEPMIFTLSSLYNLLFYSFNYSAGLNDNSIESFLSFSDKEKNRFENWKKDREFIDYSHRMTEKFYFELNQKLKSEKDSLLVANHLEHIRIMAHNAERKIFLFKKLLSKNLAKADEIVKALQKMQEYALNFDSSMNNRLDLTIKALESEIEKEISGFFAPSNGRAYQMIKRFIENYNFDYEKYELMFDKTGFNNTIYHMFHDFRAQFDTFITEKFASELSGFIKEKEEVVDKCFREFYSLYSIDPLELFSEFNDLTDGSLLFYIKDLKTKTFKHKPFDFKAVKGILGLVPPKPFFAARYSARIKFDSITGFCFHFLSEIINRTLKQKSRDWGYSGLQNAGMRIKKQTLQSILPDLNAYSAELGTQYFLKLIPAVSRDFHDKLMSELQVCDIEMEKINALVKSEQWEKESQIQILDSITIFLKKIYSDLDTFFYRLA